MRHTYRTPFAVLAALAVSGSCVTAQQTPPNPYRVADEAFGNLPEGRSWGAASAVYPAPDGRSIWVADRCGENDCAAHPEMNTVFQFDREGNVWIADATGYRDAPEGLGHAVYKFSPTGELLMTLGTKGVAGVGPDTFTRPSDVLVAPDGDIFVVDGHGEDANRLLKFSSDGTFVAQWGGTGEADGQLQDPHALAMDSQGRLFVGDRANSRIQIFDQDGNHLATWTQFGRPSGLFIDSNDILYAADSESNDRRNPGVLRGIYIGSARTGEVTAFIPDTADPNRGPMSGTSGAEGVAVDADGAIYGAEVGPRTIRKYVRR
jgi:DNA-binding beta-propeller fold protein YncE